MLKVNKFDEGDLEKLRKDMVSKSRGEEFVSDHSILNFESENLSSDIREEVDNAPDSISRLWLINHKILNYAIKVIIEKGKPTLVDVD